MKDWKACIRTWENRSKNKSNNSKLDNQLEQWKLAKI